MGDVESRTFRTFTTSGWVTLSYEKPTLDPDYPLPLGKTVVVELHLQDSTTRTHTPPSSTQPRVYGI